MLCKRTAVLLTLVSCGACTHAVAGNEIKATHSKIATTASDRDPRSRTSIDRRAADEHLTVENVRLEPAPDAEGLPATILTFDVLNRGSMKVTDLVVEVSIVEQVPSGSVFEPLRLVAGPFTIRGTAVLDLGFTLACEMRFQNLPSNCRCLPTVTVLSARSVPDGES